MYGGDDPPRALFSVDRHEAVVLLLRCPPYLRSSSFVVSSSFLFILPYPGRVLLATDGTALTRHVVVYQAVIRTSTKLLRVGYVFVAKCQLALINHRTYDTDGIFFFCQM